MSTAVPLQIQVKKPETFRRHYEFWLHKELVGTLDYQKWFTKLAILKIKDKQWKINTVGFWKSHIEITADQSPFTKSRIDFKWNFKISFSFDNRQYHLKRVGFWNQRWVWQDDKNNEVMEMKSKMFSKKNRGIITLHQPPSTDLYFLMLLGWFQVLGYEQHASTAAAAV
jgi:hypothetical protein